MVESLLPPDPSGGRQVQRFGLGMGPQTVFSNWTWGNSASIVVTDGGTHTLTITSTGGTTTSPAGTLPVVMSSSSLVQAGSSVVTLAGAPLSASVSFAKAFPTTADVVIVCNGDAAAQPTMTVAAGGIGASSFTVTVTSGGSAGTARVNWVAWGH